MRTLRILSGLAALLTALSFARHVIFHDYFGASPDMTNNPIYWAFMAFAVCVLILAFIGVYLLIWPRR